MSEGIVKKKKYLSSMPLRVERWYNGVESWQCLSSMLHNYGKTGFCSTESLMRLFHSGCTASTCQKHGRRMPYQSSNTILCFALKEVMWITCWWPTPSLQLTTRGSAVTMCIFQVLQVAGSPHQRPPSLFFWRQREVCLKHVRSIFKVILIVFELLVCMLMQNALQCYDQIINKNELWG